MSDSVVQDLTRPVVAKQGASMNAAVRQETPLHHVTFKGAAEGGVHFEELGLQGHLTLRGNASDAGFVAGVKSALGVDLPTQPLTSAVVGEVSVHWIGPSEWLVIVPGQTEAAVEARLKSALTGHFSVFDVSGGQTIFKISGDDVMLFMKKTCEYDIEEELPVGKTVSTHFAKATCVLHRQSADTFLVGIGRSFADYAWRWLVDASEEYGLKVKG